MSGVSHFPLLPESPVPDGGVKVTDVKGGGIFHNQEVCLSIRTFYKATFRYMK